MAGACSVLLVAFGVAISTRAVQADVQLPRFASAPPLGSALVTTTPEMLAPQLTPAQIKAFKLRGLASWYGGVFNGRTTANGERFNMFAMTACHPTLPFGSLVRVVNVHNHRSVVVRINDRGDLIEERRVIDLSYGAAERLGMTKAGLAQVKLEVISLGKHRNSQ